MGIAFGGTVVEVTIYMLCVIASLLSSPAWLAGFGLMLTGLACQVMPPVT